MSILTYNTLLLLLLSSLNDNELNSNQSTPDSSIEISLSNFANAIALQDYDLALSIADSMTVQDPTDPQPHALRATVFYVRGLDYELPEDSAALSEACHKVEQICSEMIKNGDKTAAPRFFWGITSSFNLFNEFGDNASLKVIRAAINIGKLMEEAHRLDDEYWDAYFGLGTYYYYRSAKAGILRTLGLVADRRKEGIKMLEIAAERGPLTSIMARASLVWIEIDRGKPLEAVKRAEDLVADHPYNRSFMWALGRSYREAKMYEESLVIYRRLLLSIRSTPVQNPSHQVSCLSYLARGLAKLGRWEEVYVTAQEALAVELPDRMLSKRTRELNTLTELVKETQKYIDVENFKPIVPTPINQSSEEIN